MRKAVKKKVEQGRKRHMKKGKTYLCPRKELKEGAEEKSDKKKGEEKRVKRQHQLCITIIIIIIFTVS